MLDCKNIRKVDSHRQALTAHIKYVVGKSYGKSKKNIARRVGRDKQDPYLHLMLKLAGLKMRTKRRSGLQQFMHMAYDQPLADPDNPSEVTSMRDKVNARWSAAQTTSVVPQGPIPATPSPSVDSVVPPVTAVASPTPSSDMINSLNGLTSIEKDWVPPVSLMAAEPEQGSQSTPVAKSKSKGVPQTFRDSVVQLFWDALPQDDRDRVLESAEADVQKQRDDYNNALHKPAADALSLAM